MVRKCHRFGRGSPAKNIANSCSVPLPPPRSKEANTGAAEEEMDFDGTNVKM